MKIQQLLKKVKIVVFLYDKYKILKLNYYLKKRVKGKYTFIDRKKDKDKLCIILAGYKEYLYDDVFDRVKKFVPKDFDICIVSSGLYSKKLETFAEKNNWSYLSTKKNKVTLAQNIAINVFNNAKYILKMDEDIFLTKNTIFKVIETYNYVENNTPYNIGFAAPLLPINGYCHIRILDILGLKEEFESKFGKLEYTHSSDYTIVNNSEAAKYMWGNTNTPLKNIDKIGLTLSKNDFSFSICPIKFSIGCIYFSRILWNEMGRFIVQTGPCMGVDEVQMCRYLLDNNKVIAVSENALAGHFSYGPQNEEMKKYYKKNINDFKLK